MKKIILFSTSIILAGAAIMSFVPPGCVQQFLGTKTLYKPYSTSTTDVAPMGYQPVFINYVGRHGARHTTNTNGSYYIKHLLAKAAAENALTTKGKALQAMVDRFIVVEQPQKLGLLTKTGEQELYGIGHRMARRVPMLFSHNVPHHYSVITTKEERTRQSAEHFMDGLGYTMRNDADVSLDTMDSVHLRFYDISDAYRQFEKNGSWMQSLQQMTASAEGRAMNAQIISELFNPSFVAKIDAGKLTDSVKGRMVVYTPERITDAIFGMAGITDALSHEIIAAGYTRQQLDMRSLFTCDQLKWMGTVNEADDFLKKAPGTDNNGIQVRDAVPLLVNFINTTDSALAGGKETAVLRFAHAETMAPLAALMDIDGSCTPTKDLVNLNRVWNANFTICFSANLQWILYRNAKDGQDVLIKMLYNEKPARIPVATDMFPYYRWSAVRDYYMKKLEGYNVTLSADMQQYLVNLK